MLALALFRAVLAAEVGPAGAIEVTLGGADACCAARAEAALSGLAFVAEARVRADGSAACLLLAGPADPVALAAALEAGGFQAGAITPVAGCPERVGRGRDPWDGAAGLDVAVLSRGEAVDLSGLPLPGRFTVLDFGAPWCSPCYASAELIRLYLRDHPDVSVRAVWLDAPDPDASFALPIARQELRWAAGLPWLKVWDPRGKLIYEGSDAAAALARIDRRRR